MSRTATTLAEVLAAFAREGELYERLPDGRVRCYACGHRCLILPGQRGICKVRWNADGRLLVPWGYVAALQVDPVEKKPFFHVLPGARALSFGMLGCDYHCAYCTGPETLIATTRGPVPIRELFDAAPASGAGDEVRDGGDLEVYAHTGRVRKVRALVRHRYAGPLVTVTPAALLPLRVTPDHGVLAVTAAELEAGDPRPTFVPAGALTTCHYLAVPRHFEFSRLAVFDVPALLRSLAGRLSAARLPGARVLRRLLGRGARGRRERGRGLVGLVRLRAGRVWGPGVREPGIPGRLPLDERLARLLGAYAAEGRVVHHRAGVHRHDLVFALRAPRAERAEALARWLAELFGVEPRVTRSAAAVLVTVRHAGLAGLFEALAGTGARKKRLPPELFEAPRPVVEAFLHAFVEGAGHRSLGGLVWTATASRQVALGVAWLALKTGRLPSLRVARAHRGRAGAAGRVAPPLFHVYWFEPPGRRPGVREDATYYYVPVRRVSREPYDGYVYNLEVADDHSYLAQYVGTHNCQNFITSQALRDPIAGVPPEPVTPEEIVRLAHRAGARIVTSTYNEPLITSEWAVEIFRRARAAGLVCSYVSNGNATPEVLDYLRPWVDLYKVDLKGFDDRHYRKLGGLLQTVLDAIRLIHAKGFWLEVVTLVVPGFNDSDDELRAIARFLASVSPDIPWHVTAFHPDYKMTDRDATPAATLVRAAELGRAEGLRYVYAGNLPGRVGRYENTYCPTCDTLLVERVGYLVRRNRLAATGGHCPACGTRIPGLWGAPARAAGDGAPAPDAGAPCPLG